MQALKVMVIVMGVAIVAILVVVVVTIMQRGTSGALSGAEGFGEVAFTLPAGCTLAAAEAAEGRLILRLEGLPERGCQQVVVLDLESGRELGRITATAAP